MSKHTPGPWEYIPSKETANSWFITHNKMPIAQVYLAFLENEPNARLIAAAPEMLEACDLFMQHYDAGANFDETLLRKIAKVMSAARSKALGESESPVTSERKSE